MDLQISIADGEQQPLDLADLYRWLTRDDDVASSTKIILVARASDKGHMGGAFDVINLVLTHGESLANVALAYATWRRSRPHAPALTFENDHMTVRVDDGSPQTVSRIIDAFESISEKQQDQRGPAIDDS